MAEWLNDFNLWCSEEPLQLHNHAKQTDSTPPKIYGFNNNPMCCEWPGPRWILWLAWWSWKVWGTQRWLEIPNLPVFCVSKTRNKKGNFNKIRKTFWGIASQFASWRLCWRPSQSDKPLLIFGCEVSGIVWFVIYLEIFQLHECFFDSRKYRHFGFVDVPIYLFWPIAQHPDNFLKQSKQ